MQRTLCEMSTTVKCATLFAGHRSLTSQTLSQWKGSLAGKAVTDAMAVVDADLRVRGVQRLRVIDSSVMPTITGSNIHAPTVMIAEKGAHAISCGGPALSDSRTGQG